MSDMEKWTAEMIPCTLNGWLGSAVSLPVCAQAISTLTLLSDKELTWANVFLGLVWVENRGKRTQDASFSLALLWAMYVTVSASHLKSLLLLGSTLLSVPSSAWGGAFCISYLC